MFCFHKNILDGWEKKFVLLTKTFPMKQSEGAPDVHIRLTASQKVVFLSKWMWLNIKAPRRGQPGREGRVREGRRALEVK